MPSKALLLNKKKVLAYNRFRKSIFAELAPKDGEVVLYLLPWMLSVNSPAVPGYIEEMQRPWKVFQIDSDREIASREASFMRRFGISTERSLLEHSPSTCWIEGIYTIGSAGSIAQTSRSDCDIWVCIDRSEAGADAVGDLRRKINLIKDWLDQNVKIPIYFFLSDVDDIRHDRFGLVEGESSGSAQRNVLKEEFYRTALIVGGKIPLWWLYGGEGAEDIDYETFAQDFRKGELMGEYDLIDLGNIETVGHDEYFGSALWQFNKAMTHPLKSIMKMLLLKMLLESPRKELLCHRFRRTIIERPNGEFLDPATFTLQAILEHYRDLPEKTFTFIMECFYLRHDIKLLSGKVTIREKLARNIFKQYNMTRESMVRLNAFASWDFQEQAEFGARIFELLRTIYTDIAAMEKNVKGVIEPKDLQVMGQKLSACLGEKNHKVPIIHKPLEDLTKPALVFQTAGQVWSIYTAGSHPAPIVESPDIVYCIAYLVWNNLFIPTNIRMLPNTTSITLQEIFNLGKKIGDFFGISDIEAMEFTNYLEPDRIEKALIVVNFGMAWDQKDISDLYLIYRNNWGELFVRRRSSPEALRNFLGGSPKISAPIEVQYYIQRNSLLYEKIIERTKQTTAKRFLS